MAECLLFVARSFPELPGCTEALDGQGISCCPYITGHVPNVLGLSESPELVGEVRSGLRWLGSPGSGSGLAGGRKRLTMAF